MIWTTLLDATVCLRVHGLAARFSVAPVAGWDRRSGYVAALALWPAREGSELPWLTLDSFTADPDELLPALIAALGAPAQAAA